MSAAIQALRTRTDPAIAEAILDPAYVDSIRIAEAGELGPDESGAFKIGKEIILSAPLVEEAEGNKTTFRQLQEVLAHETVHAILNQDKAFLAFRREYPFASLVAEEYVAHKESGSLDLKHLAQHLDERFAEAIREHPELVGSQSVSASDILNVIHKRQAAKEIFAVVYQGSAFERYKAQMIGSGLLTDSKLVRYAQSPDRAFAMAQKMRAEHRDIEVVMVRGPDAKEERFNVDPDQFVNVVLEDGNLNVFLVPIVNMAGVLGHQQFKKQFGQTVFILSREFMAKIESVWYDLKSVIQLQMAA